MKKILLMASLIFTVEAQAASFVDTTSMVTSGRGRCCRKVVQAQEDALAVLTEQGSSASSANLIFAEAKKVINNALATRDYSEFAHDQRVIKLIEEARPQDNSELNDKEAAKLIVIISSVVNK